MEEVIEVTTTDKTDTEWRALLTPEQYHVLRQEGTEPSFSSPLDHEHRSGHFVCGGCGLQLFLAEMKYESGTGWPSFTAAISGHVVTKRDFKLFLPRTEYHCARCGGHQGHLFDDSASPSGKRYCNNGLALKFCPQVEA